jgi:membrane protease subunit HflK
MAVQTRALADELQLTGTHVFFNEDWVPYDDRLNFFHWAVEYAGVVVPVARCEAEKTVDEAKASALERRVRAESDAARFLALSAAHRTAPETTETRMYIETAERVLPGARKVIRSARGGPQGYELWLRGDGAPVVPPPVATPVTPAAAQPRRTMANVMGLTQDDDL